MTPYATRETDEAAYLLAHFESRYWEDVVNVEWEGRSAKFVFEDWDAMSALAKAFQGRDGYDIDALTLLEAYKYLILMVKSNLNPNRNHDSSYR